MSGEDFTFKEVTEQSEQLDYNRMKPCLHCQKPIPQDAITCYYCGKNVNHNRWMRWAMIIVGSIILLRFIAGAIGAFNK